jgi:cystathionine beta-lyase/cystathionine gamma-synthase
MNYEINASGNFVNANKDSFLTDAIYNYLKTIHYYNQYESFKDYFSFSEIPFQPLQIKRLQEVDNFYDHCSTYEYLNDDEIITILKTNPSYIENIINPTKEMIDIAELLEI